MMWAVTIGGAAVDIIARGFGYDLVTTGVSTASFMYRADQTDAPPTLGAVVTITDPAGTEVFGGVLVDYEVTIDQDYAATSTRRQYIHCTARGASEVAHRRFVWHLAEDSDKTGATAAALVAFVNAYREEGLTAAGAAGGATLSGQTFFDGVTLAQALDWLALKSGNDYIWYIDKDKDLFFGPRTTTSAAFNISNANTGASFNFKFRKTMAQYRNAQYVFGSGGGKTEEISEEETGVTGQERFGQRYNVRKINSATQGGAALTVGVDGIGTDFGSNIYYRRDDRETRLGAALGGGDAKDFIINYNGKRRVVGYSEDTAAIRQYGLFQKAYINDNIRTDREANMIADALRTRHGSFPTHGSYHTYTDGLLPGTVQTIALTDYDVDGTFSIERVSTTMKDTADFKTMEYVVQVSSGVALGTDDDFVRELVRRTDRLQINNGELLDRVETQQDNGLVTVAATLALI